MKKGPKISFIIPVYNAKKLWGGGVKKCIQSIQAQTYKNIEIICINDGSTDKSLEVLQQLQKTDKRIIIINQQNKGIFLARKAGILKATGDYIMFSDCDDSLPDKTSCEKLIKIFEDNSDVQIIQFARIYSYYKLIRTINSPSISGKIELSEFKNKYYKDFIGSNKFKAVSNYLWDKIYRADLVKTAVEKINFYYAIGEDVYLNLIIFDSDELKNIYIVKYPFYLYNVGIGISSKNHKYFFPDYGQLKQLQMELCDKWKLPKDAKYQCNLETVYYLLSIVKYSLYINKESDEEILKYLHDANELNFVQMAKDYFNSRPKEELYEELLFLVNAKPEDYLKYVKENFKKPKNKLQIGFDFILRKIGLKK